MNHSELSHMADAVDDSTINIVVIIIISIIINKKKAMSKARHSYRATNYKLQLQRRSTSQTERARSLYTL